MARILVFFGMTASGKSTLAALCATRHRAPHHNTDRVRKELAGLAANTRRPDGIGRGIYTRELSERTYTTMLERAAADIRAGQALVILDGSYASRESREGARKQAASLGAELRFIRCVCGEAETIRRLNLRARDSEAVSDGRLEIYRHQQQSFAEPDAAETDVFRLDTEDAPEHLLTRLEAAGVILPPVSM